MNENLKNTINTIIADIDNPAYKIEQNVRSGIIYSILDDLGWNSKNKKEVFDEFSVIKNFDNKDITTRVDIALLDENNKSQDKPLVFMELKAIDKIKKDEGEKQLFGYTNYMTPIISILTNGKEWYFYNNFDSGNFSTKLFLTLNLCENNIDKVVNYLTLFLHKDNYNFDDFKNSKCLKEINQIKEKENKLAEIKKYLKEHFVNANFDDSDWQEIKNYCFVKTEKVVAEQALNIFSPLNNNIANIVKGSKPKNIIIDNKNFDVNSWQEVFIKFLNFIKDDNRFNMEKILSDQKKIFGKKDGIITWEKLEQKIQHREDVKNRYKSFDGLFSYKIKNIKNNELFINIDISAKNCIEIIANIMNEFDINEDFVKISIN